MSYVGALVGDYSVLDFEGYVNTEESGTAVSDFSA